MFVIYWNYALATHFNIVCMQLFIMYVLTVYRLCIHRWPGPPALQTLGIY